MDAMPRIFNVEPFTIWRDLNRRRRLLHALAAQVWGGLPPYSTLKTPKIVDIEAVPVASGTALIFEEFGIAKIVLIQAGAHYAKDTQGDVLYMIPGGFINLTETPGSSSVAPSSEPESPAIGAVRKIEKKLCNDRGEPLLQVHPDRLLPMDILTLLLKGRKKRVVVGHMLKLAANEVGQIRAHIAKTRSNTKYRKNASAHTINPSSGQPEVVEICIFDLSDAAGDRVPLLHRDQLSLFNRVFAYTQRKNGQASLMS